MKCRSKSFVRMLSNRFVIAMSMAFSAIMLLGGDAQVQYEWRSWNTKSGNVIRARLCGFDDVKKMVIIEKQDSGKVVGVMFSRLSQSDIDYVEKIITEARKNGIVTYKRRFKKVLGCISENLICVEDKDGSPLIIRSSDLLGGDVGVIKRLLSGDDAEYDDEIKEITESYIRSSSAGALVEPIVVRRFTDGSLVQKEAKLIETFRLPEYFLSDYKFTGAEASNGSKTPPHHEWNVGHCLREVNGEIKKYPIEVSDIDGAVKLLYGWMCRHRNDYDVIEKLRKFDLAKRVFKRVLGTKTSTYEKSEYFYPKACGTAFAITDDGYLLTCSHVVSSAKEILVISNYMFGWAEIVAVDKELDLALLKIPEMGIDFLRFPKEERIVDNRKRAITSYGFPEIDEQGTSIKITRGYGYDSEDGSRLLFSATVYHGNSGGPVVDNEGLVVGLVQGVDNAGRYVAIKPESVLDFIDRYLPSRKSKIMQESTHAMKEDAVKDKLAKRATALVVVYK